MQIIKAIPVITGAAGAISKSFRKYPIGVLGKHVRELEETAILGTAHLPWEVLISKYTTFNMGNNITCRIYCNYRIPATLHILVTMFVSGL